MGFTDQRQATSAVALDTPADASIAFPLGSDEIELDAIVIRVSARTAVVELASGASTLALAVAPACELSVRRPGLELRIAARPGRRIDDVPESRQIELVLLGDLDLEQRDG